MLESWNTEIFERKERCRFIVEHGNIIERGYKYKNKKLLVLHINYKKKKIEVKKMKTQKHFSVYTLITT